MKDKKTLRHRFLLSLVIYAAVILALWVVYHTTTHKALRRSERENTILAADSLTQQISSELRQMNTIASVIAGSEYVQDFLAERDAVAYYEKAITVSEIVRRAAFPISSADSVVTINEAGRFFRFSGGLSNRSLETLFEAFGDSGIVYTITELDGTLYFCHIVPVIDYSGQLPTRLGKIIMLTGLDRTRRMLGYGDGVDRVVILDGFVILSSNPELEGIAVAEFEPGYGVVSIAPIDGTPLSVAAAIPGGALLTEGAIFYVIAFVTLFLLLGMVLMLYRYQSRNIVAPAIAELQRAFDAEIARKNMQMSLLACQMDVHFVVNTLKNVKRLADKGEKDKTAHMAEGLAAILQHRYAGDALVNIFDEFQILQQYIDIMSIRFGGTFEVEYDVADSLEACVMPGLILQPIVENALTHGLQGKDGGAILIISGRISELRTQNSNLSGGEAVVFKISDNGKGIPPEKLKEIQISLAQTEFGDFLEPGLRGVALVNIQRRIRLRCGGDYGITIDSSVGKGTTVTVCLPVAGDH